jgi:diacylglycerol kinase family enzyme
MASIGLVINPNAKAVRTDPMLPRRLAEVGGKSTVVVETRDLEELAEAVQAFRSRGVEVVASCGGDGSNVSLLTEMVRAYGADRVPPLAMLRGGTVNTVANNLNIRGSPEAILSRLVACRNRGMVEPSEVRSLLCINGTYGFFFGAAFPARFYERYNKAPAPGTAWASLMAARVTLSALFRTRYARSLFAPVGARILADGVALPHDRFTLVLASTLMSVGLKIRITYRAMEQEGHFHLIATGLPASRLARQFHKTFLARPLSGPSHFDLLPRDVRVEFEEPQPYTIDGDLFRDRQVTITNGPRVRLCIP